MKLSAPELLLDAQAALGEGPAWNAVHRCLSWVDIHAGRLHLYNPSSGEQETLSVDPPLGCAAPAQGGKFILGMRHGIALLHPQTGQLSVLASPEAHLPGNRFNDGKCGPDGRFLAGTMDNSEKEASGALYSYAPNGALKTLVTGVRISNGLAWSRDYRTLYYIDTPTFEVKAYDYDLESGEIANPRVVISIPPRLGFPDGMTSDAAGRLWIGMWGGAAVTVWNPNSGQLLETLPLPAKNVTACVFGGENGTDLFITSARQGLTRADLSEYPLSGGLFRVQTNVEGMPTFSFGG
ncbi:MAG: SMP-30/gluconolactonase/LRE family protein [Anaerolineales bacterium]|nr:SMP-30/gluconolactonase/LRE family protein [Anaerolineales bacterium]MCX7755373.1 SMP-30/gluconolactonase/LRE family protein [Anaerolineales bacterium]MDW8279112.1 SMP-30/gluconolactonase/LRE family protein [Anaerolineales bacterium]